MRVASLILVLLISASAQAEILIDKELKLRPRDKSMLLDLALAELSFPLHEIRSFKGNPSRATLIFGPLKLKSNLFKVLLVRCVRLKKSAWDCSPPVRQDFAYSESTDNSIRFHTGVEPQAAVSILKEAEAKCSMYFNDSFVFKPELRASEKTGEYRLFGGGCTYTFNVHNGEAKIGLPFDYLE